MLAIADAYEHGDGVKKSDAKALSWYTKAANAGVAEAQSKLGEAYEKGRLGVKKDKNTALDWYRKAAAQGDKDAASKAEDLAKDLSK
jgi:TPR repeat protein